MSESKLIRRTARICPRFRRLTERTGGRKPFRGEGRISSLSLLRDRPVQGHRVRGRGRRMNSGRAGDAVGATALPVAGEPGKEVAFMGAGLSLHPLPGLTVHLRQLAFSQATWEIQNHLTRMQLAVTGDT